MKKRKDFMKKILYLCMVSALAFSLCGCGESAENSENEDIQSSTAVVSDVQESEIVQESVISRNENKTVSAPADSISFDEACAFIDKLSMKDLELPQSAVNFKKYYFGTVEYKNKPYYSVYFYVEKDEKKVFVGNNILVSCDGGYALIKNFYGMYEVLEGESTEDADYRELYPDAKTEPAEALKALTEKNLKMEYTLSQYLFDFLTEAQDINGVNCYVVVPKIEFAGSTTMYRKLYISTDGKNTVFTLSSDGSGEYIELE